jgi:SET domain-containing protein
MGVAVDLARVINDSDPLIEELEDDTVIVGLALYALTSYFNHSCEPNCMVYFPKNNHVVCILT